MNIRLGTVIAFRPEYVQLLGSIPHAIYLSQIVTLSHTGDYVRWSNAELGRATMLSPWQIKTAHAACLKEGLIEVRADAGKASMIRARQDVIEQRLRAMTETHAETDPVGNQQGPCVNNIYINNHDELKTKHEQHVVNVIHAYELILPRLPKIKTGTALYKRVSTMIRARKRSELEWKEYFARCARSQFLSGANQTGWRPSLEWLVKPANIDKVEAGNYDGGSAKPTRRAQIDVGSFADGESITDRSARYEGEI